MVGVGTAVTVDLLDAAGRHHGGRIAPSPQLMRDALHAAAAQLPAQGGDYVEFAADTVDALASGCDGVISGLWGPHFVSWVKQASPLGFFDKIKWISGGEIAAHEIAGELKGEALNAAALVLL